MDRQQLGGGDCCGRGAPEETEEVEERVFGVAAVSPTRLAWKVMQEGCPFASTTRLSTTPPMFQERILKSVIDGWLCLGRHGISTNLPVSIVNDSIQPLSRTIAVPFCVRSLTFWVSQSSRYCTVQPSCCFFAASLLSAGRRDSLHIDYSQHHAPPNATKSGWPTLLPSSPPPDAWIHQLALLVVIAVRADRRKEKSSE